MNFMDTVYFIVHHMLTKIPLFHFSVERSILCTIERKGTVLLVPPSCEHIEWEHIAGFNPTMQTKRIYISGEYLVQQTKTRNAFIKQTEPQQVML